MSRLVIALLVAAIAISLVSFAHDIHTNGWLAGYHSCQETYS